MPLEYVAALLLAWTVFLLAFGVAVLYAKGYLSPRPARPGVRPLPPTPPVAAAVPEALGVEGVVQARIEAESQVSKTLAKLKMQTQMLESGLQVTKPG